jgi:hypothetical protein
VVLRLQFSVDPALRCWVLGFGHHARVLKPSALATDILEELEEAREHYVPPIPFDREPPMPDQPGLAFLPFSGAPPRGAASRRPGRARPARPGTGVPNRRGQ